MKYSICNNFDCSQLHLKKSIPHLTIEISKFMCHQLAFLPKINKQIQSVFGGLQVTTWIFYGYHFKMDHRIFHTGAHWIVNSCDTNQALAKEYLELEALSTTAEVTSTVSFTTGFLCLHGSTPNSPVSSNFIIIFKSFFDMGPFHNPFKQWYSCSAAKLLLPFY